MTITRPHCIVVWRSCSCCCHWLTVVIDITLYCCILFFVLFFLFLLLLLLSVMCRQHLRLCRRPSSIISRSSSSACPFLLLSRCIVVSFASHCFALFRVVWHCVAYCDRNEPMMGSHHDYSLLIVLCA